MEANFTMIPQSDGYQTKLYYYPTEKEVLGSILILHGMAEHCVRYVAFAEVLNNEGFDVYLYNHRGHGEDCAPENLGFFAAKDGAELVITDAITICRHIKQNGRSNKLSVLGHSMGSLILRNVIQRYDEMDSVIICATTMPAPGIAGAGVALANLLCRLQGPKRRSEFLHNMMFGNKYYNEICTRTPCDWLTRDEAIVDWYQNDPYCGFVCTTSMYRDMLLFVRDSGNETLIARTRKNLPIYFVVGEKDPVSSYSTEVAHLFDIFVKSDFTDIVMTVYPEARHEILNELNKQDVMEDMIAFFHETLCGK